MDDAYTDYLKRLEEYKKEQEEEQRRLEEKRVGLWWKRTLQLESPISLLQYLMCLR